MKKDPLLREPTAYDLLGVEPGAGTDEVERAAGDGDQGPGRAPADMREAARTALKDPVRRALVDIFLYQDQYLDELAFNDPVESLGGTAVRRAVAERWREVERRGFPKSAAIHSIAVLSYWEARSSGRNGPDLPTPPDVTGRLWQAALTRFAALIASDSFWTEWGVLTGNRGSGEVGSLVAARLEERLAGELERMAETLRDRGDVPGEARIREHLALFRAELRAARSLPELRVLSGRGLSPVAIAAGPHLLAEVGLLEKVRASVEAQRPDLLPLFSPLAFIGEMVDEKEYEGAFGALDRLDTTARESREAKELETRIQLALGQRALEADRLDEAFGHWERAHAAAEVRSQVADPIANAVLVRAKLLNSRDDRDGAIGLLQRALPLAERAIIGVPLAHFLFERANARIESATAASGEGETDLGPAVADMRGAVADLEEAVELDPTNNETRDRRNQAEDLLQALLLRAGPGVETVAAEPVVDEEPAVPPPATASPKDTRASVLMTIGAALWVGVGLLALVAYPLLMPQYLGGTGTIIGLGVAIAWIATNAIGWVMLR